MNDDSLFLSLSPCGPTTVCGDTGRPTRPQGARLWWPAEHSIDPHHSLTHTGFPISVMSFPLGLKVLSPLDSSHLYNSTQLWTFKLYSFKFFLLSSSSPRCLQQPGSRRYCLRNESPLWWAVIHGYLQIFPVLPGSLILKHGRMAISEACDCLIFNC